ncbi:ATP-dependent RNA helicase mtr4, partial [Cladochytrium tenue]
LKKRLGRKFYWLSQTHKILVLFIVMIAISATLDFKGRGIAVLGPFDNKLHAPQLPPLNPELLKKLIGPAMTIALNGFVKCQTVTRDFGLKHGYFPSGDQELFSLGPTAASCGTITPEPTAPRGWRDSGLSMTPVSYVNVDEHPSAEMLDGVLLLRIEVPLLFYNRLPLPPPADGSVVVAPWRVPARTYPFTLDPFQSTAISIIERNESVLVSAYTSAGKTGVAESRDIYTSPITALSNQKYCELLQEFGNPGAGCLHDDRDPAVHAVLRQQADAGVICSTHPQPCHIVFTDYRPAPLQHYLFPAGDGIHLVVDENRVPREDNFSAPSRECEKNALQLSNLDINDDQEKQIVVSVRWARTTATSFSIGLNMPAKTVVFTMVNKLDWRGNRWLTGGEYIQMSGRAGRRGLDDRRIVIVMVDEIEPDVAKACSR